MILDNSEGNKVIEDLQARVQLLGQQVSLLQRENMISKETLEKEKSTRQTLELQLETKNQFIHSLTSQQSPLNSRRSTVNPIPNSRSNSPSKTKTSRVHVNFPTTIYSVFINLINCILIFRFG